MRFRGLLIASFALLVLLVLLLLGQQSLMSTLTISIIFSIILIVQIVLTLIDDYFSATHALLTGVSFLSLGYLVINLMGPATLTTFFLGGSFILMYVVMIVIIAVYNWKQYHMFDRMIDAMQHREGNDMEKEVIPVEHLLEEPPHVRLHRDDDGDWVELKVKKPAKKAARKTTRKTAKKARKTRKRK